MSIRHYARRGRLGLVCHTADDETITGTWTFTDGIQWGDTVLLDDTSTTDADPNIASTVLLLKFEADDGDYKFTDSSGNGNHGWLAGGVNQNLSKISSTQAKFGTTSFFVENNFGGHVVIPYRAGDFDFGTNDFTLEWYNRPEQTTIDEAIMSNLESSNGTITVWRNASNDIQFTIRDGTTTKDHETHWPSGDVIGTWKHKAVVRDGDQMYYYVDGVSQTPTFGTGALSASYSVATVTNNWRIGDYNLDVGTAFTYDGYIDNVRITNGVARYPGGTPFTPPTTEFSSDTIAESDASSASVTGLYSFDGANAATTFTNAGSGVDPTFNGDAALSNAIALAGTTSLRLSGNNDSCVTLDTGNDGIDNFGSSDFTVELFWRRDGAGTGTTIIGRGAASSPTTFSYRIYAPTSASEIVMEYSDGTTAYTKTVDVGDPAVSGEDQWMHLALVRSGDSMHCFRDGVLEDQVWSGTPSAGFTVPYDTGEKTVIGATWDGANYVSETTGYVAAVRITPGVARYTANFRPNSHLTSPVTDAPPGTSGFTVGDPTWELVLDGSTLAINANTTITGTLDVTGALTAASYDGIDAANLLDKTAVETVSGAYTFTGGVTMTTGNLVAGTIDADFDAITATSYGGIAEANLLDKSATETVSGSWTFTSDILQNEASPFIRQTETGVTNTPEWWLGADGGNYSLRLNNTPPYALIVNTNATNDAITDLELNYDTAITGALTATSYGGITEANLLDKTATETISGAWNWSTANLNLDNNIYITGDDSVATPRTILGVANTNITYVGNNNLATTLRGSTVTVDNATTINGDTTLNGATVNLAPTGNINVTAGGNFQILSGAGFRIYNSGNTDYVDHSHDGTDFTTTFVNTTDWNITGLAGNNIIFQNNLRLNWRNSSALDDGTELYRATGNALRLHYAANAFVLQAINDNSISIRDSSDSATITMYPVDGSIDFKEANIWKSGGTAHDNLHLRDTTDAVDLLFHYDGVDWTINSETSGGGNQYVQFDDSTGAVSLFHGGNKRLVTASNALTVRGNSSGDNQIRYIQVADSAGTAYMQIGQLGASESGYIRYKQVSGPIRIEATDAASAIRLGYFQDPDAGTIVRGDTNVEIEVANGENAIVARANAEVELYYNDVEKFTTKSNGVGVTGGLFIDERTAAPTNEATRGILWVKNTTPCQLWFTDDAGSDTQIV